MRDERWVDRFLFAWNNTLFYDPLDIHYRPRDHGFLSTLDSEARSRFFRSGLWWMHRPTKDLRPQGWKIHISATHRNARTVAEKAIHHLVADGVDFKIALDLNIFEVLNSKAMSRGSSGKLMTVYPRDDDHFRVCLDDLARVLEGCDGAYVLSDMRYKDSKALYFRYGQLLDTHTVDIMGRKVPHIIGPDGPISDARQPVFVQPWWLPWPFSDWKPAADTDDGDLVAGRFRVTEAIKFSNSGGVYLAEDTLNGDKPVILKEARPHTNPNLRQAHDAVDILAREWRFLNLLADSDCFPQPVAMVTHWEHHFLAEEFIDGTDLRLLFFEHNPLVRLRFGTAESRDFLRVYLSVCSGLLHAVQAAHERHVILGDLTVTNLLIDPETCHVRIIDLETCRLAESAEADQQLQSAVEVYTPGFSHSRRNGVDKGAVPEDDLFSVATIMAYFIFPVAAMSFLRDDTLTLYRTFVDALGWPERIHQTIIDLAEARISLSEALAALADETELLGQVNTPARTAMPADRLRFTETAAGVASFLSTAADTTRDTLFPMDPFANLTNPLSLGFGASGVLWALNASGIPVQPEWLHWLRQQLDALDERKYPPGLMTGLAGIAWAVDGLGLRSRARDLLAMANRRADEYVDYTYYYGRAGLGMSNLHFYLQDRTESSLTAALKCAQALRETAHHDGKHVYWLNEYATDGPLTGLGFGQAGVALFLLRMTQITGDDSYRELGERALAWEMDNSEPTDGDSVGFRHDKTLMPYVEVGAAGVAQVLLRYGALDAARTVLRGLDVGFTPLPGYGFGMCGIADTMLDAATILHEPSYRDTALRQLDYTREIFVFEPEARFGVLPHEGVTPLAVVGEGLFRSSCDYMTGSAGVLRVLHRASTGGTADFLLDEVCQ